MTVVPADPSGAPLSWHVPRLASFALDGHFLAIGSTERVTLINLVTRRRAFSVAGMGPVSYALGDAGVLVVGTSAGGGPQCRRTLRHLAWYSPAAPTRHSLPYKACSRQMLVRGRELLFQAAARRGLIGIERGDLAGAPPRLLARCSEQGFLIDADRGHVLAGDFDHNGNSFSFVAP